MGFLDHATEGAKPETLLTLSKTTVITSQMMNEPFWKELATDYRSRSLSPEHTCATSIINAIFTHKRSFFVLTRDKTETLVRDDLNWAESAIFNNKNWGRYLAYLYSNNILKQYNSLGRATIYELIYEPVKELLDVDFEKQKEEALEFVNRKAKTTNFEPKQEKRIFVPNPERAKEIAAKNWKWADTGTDDDFR